MNTAVCIGCGCTDTNACDGGCSWLRVDRAAGLGVCSECPEKVARFDAGKRALSEDARIEVELRKVFGG
jgi:hypothetical protein